MSEWPTHQEELARKAIEVVSDAVIRHRAGEMTDADLILIVNTVYDTVSGLVPWDVANLIYNIRKALQDG